MQADELVKELSKGIISWYGFRKNTRALLIADKNAEELSELLVQRCGDADIIVQDCTDEDLLIKSCLALPEKKYDYTVVIGVLEYMKNPAAFLECVKRLLKDDGHMLVAADNRLGIRYFCGDRDPFTGRNFDGIEHYHRISPLDWQNINGRCYSGHELEEIFKSAGMTDCKFYSVFPDIRETQLVYAQNFTPTEDLSTRYSPSYNFPDTVFLEEEVLYGDLIRNGMFHSMANSYLIECSQQGVFDNVLHATLSLDRGRDNAMITIIRGDGGAKSVEKLPAYPEGSFKIQKLQEQAEDLRKHGLAVVESRTENNSFVMPFINAPTALDYLRSLAGKDREEFISAVDSFRGLILKSSEHVQEEGEGDGLGVILKRGYMDLVPINCFYVSAVNEENSFVFFDQEFYEDNCYANAIIYRLVYLLYWKAEEYMEKIIPKSFFFDRYKLSGNLRLWQKKDAEFIQKLRNQKELRPHNEKIRSSGNVMSTNRQKINYSMKQYFNIFVDIFRNVEDKKIVLFGSGRFTERFLLQFGRDYNIYRIVDNDSSKWGQELQGIKIENPEILKSFCDKEIHVIICIKNYLGTVRQLEQMGITDYHIYNPAVEYPRKLRNDGAANVNEGYEDKIHKDNSISAEEKKPYHVGYVAGVFDLFHIGHLNMFKRAKEMCDYLIVGVVSDDGVKIQKKTEPFVPFKERIEMVRSCRYVDEAVEIPYNYSGTRDAWLLYHFDVQFSGSDYEHDPVWLAEKDFLEKNGATMVFFPYTQSTSSTKLKGLINERLI